MRKILNDTQRRLVEENHNLIYTFLNSRNLSLDAIEDWYGVAAIGLCKAALSWDEIKKIKFSTYAFVCMENIVRSELKKNSNSLHNYSISMDTCLNDTDEVTIGDFVPDKNNEFNEFEFLDIVKEIYDKRNSRDKKIIDMIISCPIKQRQVADELGITRTVVTNIKTDFLKDIHKEITKYNSSATI